MTHSRTADLAVDATWPTTLRLTRDDLPICDETAHFGLFGVYNLTATSSKGNVRCGVFLKNRLPEA